MSSRTVAALALILALVVVLFLRCGPPQEGDHPEIPIAGGDGLPEPPEDPDRCQDAGPAEDPEDPARLHHPANVEARIEGAPSRASALRRCFQALYVEGEAACLDHCPAHSCGPEAAGGSCELLSAWPNFEGEAREHEAHWDARCWTDPLDCSCGCGSEPAEWEEVPLEEIHPEPSLMTLLVEDPLIVPLDPDLDACTGSHRLGSLSDPLIVRVVRDAASLRTCQLHCSSELRSAALQHCQHWCNRIACPSEGGSCEAGMAAGASVPGLDGHLRAVWARDGAGFACRCWTESLDCQCACLEDDAD